MDCVFFLSRLFRQSPVSSLIFHCLQQSPAWVFELNRARGGTYPPFFASVFIYPFHDADLAAGIPRVLALSLHWDMTPLCHSVTCLPAGFRCCRATASQSRHLRAATFLLPSLLLPGFTLSHIAPSVRDMFMPHLHVFLGLHFSFSLVSSKFPTGLWTTARHELYLYLSKAELS